MPLPSFLTTAVPGLDTVLGGGLVSGSLVFLVGTPGAGKTILANQIIFNTAHQGIPTLILTAYSEGSVKMIDHLRNLSFFDEKMVGSQVTMLSIATLIGEEPKNAARNIVQAIRQSKARVVLLDGFQGVSELLGTQRIMRRMLADLASLQAFLGVTIIVTLEGLGRDLHSSAALTTADAVISLEYSVVRGQQIRAMEVLKQRGVAPYNGIHTYTITDDGITVYPRVEAIPLGEIPEFTVERAPFGLPELDALLNGGLTARTTTILAGAPGVGKTTLGLHWALHDVSPETATLFVTFGEYPQQLRVKTNAFGLDLDTALASGALQLMHMSPLDILPDVVANRLLDALTPTICRVVLDDVAGLMYTLGDRGGTFLTALARQCYQRGVTTLFLLETKAAAGMNVDLAQTSLSLVSENVIVLQQVIAGGRLRRMLAVLKMRFSDYDQTLRELVMDRNGVRVLTPSQTVDGVLDEAARTGGGFSPET